MAPESSQAVAPPYGCVQSMSGVTSVIQKGYNTEVGCLRNAQNTTQPDSDTLHQPPSPIHTHHSHPTLLPERHLPKSSSPQRVQNGRHPCLKFVSHQPASVVGRPYDPPPVDLPIPTWYRHGRGCPARVPPTETCAMGVWVFRKKMSKAGNIRPPQECPLFDFL